MIRVSKNFESDEQYADELEKNIVQEILPGDDDSNSPSEEPPTLSEFIKSMDVARKFLQSGGASEKELDHLYGLESFAIRKKMATKKVQTNIDNHFRIDKFHVGSISNLIGYLG